MCCVLEGTPKKYSALQIFQKHKPKKLKRPIEFGRDKKETGKGNTGISAKNDTVQTQNTMSFYTRPAKNKNTTGKVFEK